MTLILATTTVTVRRPTTTEQSADPWGDGYETSPGVVQPVEGQGNVVTSGLRASIAPGGASGAGRGGETEIAEFTLMTDPADITYLDRVTDETSLIVYEVVWALTTPGVAGLGHTIAGIRTTKGTR